jgi:hypothetical protein
MTTRGHHGLLLASGDVDPYWANVVSLLHFDTGVTDSAGKVWATGSAAVSATQYKFGGGSLRTTNTLYRSSSSSSDWAFGSGDFTVEMFIRIDSLPGASQFASPWGNLTATVGCCFWVRPSTEPGALTWRARDGSSVSATSANGTIIAGQWHHIAYSRSGTTGRLFVDGALVATTTDTSTYTTTTSPAIGRNQLSADYFAGYVDEVRVTKGVARYTSTFTPPSAPFPSV